MSLYDENYSRCVSCALNCMSTLRPKVKYHGNNNIQCRCATYGKGTVHHSGAPEFTPGFNWDQYFPIFSCMCSSCSFLCPLSFGNCTGCFSSIDIFNLPFFGQCSIILTTSVYFYFRTSRADILVYKYVRTSKMYECSLLK